MEIDLFCAGHKLAIEIDGPQHLSDPTAYRRDRRKDALLQENGCHVLRFLAEDLGKHLDATLDAIRLDKDERALTFGSRLASKSSDRSRLALHGRGRVSGEGTHGAGGGEGERRAGHGTRDGRGQSTAQDRGKHTG